MKLPRRSVQAVLAVTITANVALVVLYHDRFWWPPDDGIYAHIASRLAAGEVLNRDVEEAHPGYIHFLHQATFRLFGEDFVSLRYPLMAAAVLQGVLAVLLLAGAGLPEALLAGLAAVILGVLQYLDPQPHWYCALLAVALAALLTFAPRDARWRLPAAGFLIATAFLFRQLTGVFLSGAAVTALLAEPGGAVTAHQKLAARVVLSAAALVLIAYLSSTDLVASVLFGLGPLLLLGAVAARTSVSNVQLARQAGALALGGTVAALPLVAYHLAHGSLGWCLRDVAVRAVAVVDLPYLTLPRYKFFLTGGLAVMAGGGGIRAFASGLYWCLLALLASGAAAATLHRFRVQRTLAPLCVVASFYGLVALFNQIAIYLHYTAALSLAALLLLSAGGKRLVRGAALAAGAFLLAVGLGLHAAQPISRGFRGMLAGATVALVPSGLARCSLKVDPADAPIYQAVVARIQAATSAGQPIFVFPNHAELYFLSDRPNPFRFHSTALGILRADELPPVLQRLAVVQPRIIVHAPGDQNTTAFSRDMLRQLRARYRQVETIGPFDLYEPREPRR